MICQDCLETNERFAEATSPRDHTQGYARLIRTDALAEIGGRHLPDVRLGDIIEVRLIAGSVSESSPCTNPDCENYDEEALASWRA